MKLQALSGHDLMAGFAHTARMGEIEERRANIARGEANLDVALLLFMQLGLAFTQLDKALKTLNYNPVNGAIRTIFCLGLPVSAFVIRRLANERENFERQPDVPDYLRQGANVCARPAVRQFGNFCYDYTATAAQLIDYVATGILLFHPEGRQNAIGALFGIAISTLERQQRINYDYYKEHRVFRYFLLPPKLRHALRETCFLSTNFYASLYPSGKIDRAVALINLLLWTYHQTGGSIAELTDGLINRALGRQNDEPLPAEERHVSYEQIQTLGTALDRADQDFQTIRQTWEEAKNAASHPTWMSNEAKQHLNTLITNLRDSTTRIYTNRNEAVPLDVQAAVDNLPGPNEINGFAGLNLSHNIEVLKKKLDAVAIAVDARGEMGRRLIIDETHLNQLPLTVDLSREDTSVLVQAFPESNWKTQSNLSSLTSKLGGDDKWTSRYEELPRYKCDSVNQDHLDEAWAPDGGGKAYSTRQRLCRLLGDEKGGALTEHLKGLSGKVLYMVDGLTLLLNQVRNQAVEAGDIRDYGALRKQLEEIAANFSSADEIEKADTLMTLGIGGWYCGTGLFREVGFAHEATLAKHMTKHPGTVNFRVGADRVLERYRRQFLDNMFHEVMKIMPPVIDKNDQHLYDGIEVFFGSHIGVRGLGSQNDATLQRGSAAQVFMRLYMRGLNVREIFLSRFYRPDQILEELEKQIGKALELPAFEVVNQRLIKWSDESTERLKQADGHKAKILEMQEQLEKKLGWSYDSYESLEYNIRLAAYDSKRLHREYLLGLLVEDGFLRFR